MNSSLPNGMPAPSTGHPYDQFDSAPHTQSMTALLNSSSWPRQQYPFQPHNHQWQQSQSQPQQLQNMQNGHHTMHQHPQASAPTNPMQQTFSIPAVDLGIPQQFVQDFLRLTTPVGQSPNDDSILAQALFESRQSGRTYRQALEGLHGVNNHAANLWKDYYLDHHGRFDVAVARLLEQNQKPKAVKKPFVSTPASTSETKSASPQRDRDRDLRKRQPSPSPPLRQSKQPKRSTPNAPTPSLTNRPSKRPRATLNSMSAPLLPTDFSAKLMPLQADITLPPPPSRSPTPPTKIEAGTNGNKYTEEDRVYFLKFISWRLSQDASLTKKDLCAMLHEKVPHHSATSWASHWHGRHNIADKILHSFRGDESEDQEDDEEDSGSSRSLAEVTGEDSESEVIRQTTSSNRRAKPAARTNTVSKRVASFSYSTSNTYDPSATTDTDEADMGSIGNPFTPADWRIIARYVARTPGWKDMTSRERWDGFLEKFSNNERSDKSWGEFYRRNEHAIISLSAHYKGTKWFSKGMLNMQQHGRPSWARQRGRQKTEDGGNGSEEDGDYETDDEER